MRTALEFPKYLEPISRTKSSAVEVFRDFVRMSACALAGWTREPEYLEVAKRYNKAELKEITSGFWSLIAQMESKPFADLLGSYYQEINSKATRDGRWEFYTPPEVSELMARIAFNAEKVIDDWVPVTVQEPTCGSGGMILQMAKQLAPKEAGDPSYVDLMRVTAIDIAPTSCDMAYVNLTAWGIPSEIVHGNSLSMEVWSHWRNIHWHRVGEDGRRAVEQLKNLTSETPKGTENDETPSAPVISENPDYLLKKKETSGGQFEFDLE